MDFSKLLNAIRGNKAADASAAPRNRSEEETVIPVEVAPTVIAADHPPPPRPSGGVVQSLLGQFTGHRESSPPAPPPAPVQEPANGSVDDVPASAAPPVETASPVGPLSAPTSPPLEGDWFDVSLDASTATAAADGAVLELSLEEPQSTVPPVDAWRETPPAVPPSVAAFEVAGKIDLSWTPVEGAPASLPSPPDVGDEAFLAAPPHDPSPPPLTSPPDLSPPVVTPPPPMPPPAMMFDPLADFAGAGREPVSPAAASYVPEASASGAYGEAYAETTDSADATGRAVAPSFSDADWLLEHLDEAIFLVDANGVICRMNPMAEYLLGCSRTEAQGQTLLELSRRLGGDNAPLWEHLAVTPDAQQFSTSVTLPDGQTLAASFIVMELPPLDACWPGGRVIAVRDETRLRAELTQTEEPAPVAASALNVTSEQLTAMRTSLQMVLGFAELLHRGEYGPMNPQQFEMFRNIEHHAKQLAEWLGLPQT